MTSSAVEAREITSWLQVEDIAKGLPPIVAQQKFSSRWFDTEVADSEQQAVVNTSSESDRTELHKASSLVTNTSYVRALPVAVGAHEADFAPMHEQQLAALDPVEVSTM